MYSNYIENIKTTKQHKNILIKILWLIFSIAYGLFAIVTLEHHVSMDYGDIPSYVYHFYDVPAVVTYEAGIFSEDKIFRTIAYRLQGIFNESFEVIFGYIAFICAAIFFYTCISKVRSIKHFIIILPLFLMIFLVPRVVDLYASGLRSGVAFAILIISINYFKGVVRNILMILSILTHLSMLPIISFYYLFYILDNKRINASVSTSFFTVLIWSLTIVLAAAIVHHSPGSSMGFWYVLMIFLFTTVMLLSNKKVMKNVNGFISIGLIIVVLLGVIVDFGFVRYIGNALVFYLLFILEKAGKKTIGIVTLSFIPFFTLTHLYKFTNYI